MADATELVKLIKRAAVDAIEATKPSKLVIGVVTSTSPLTVRVSEKISVSPPTLLCPETLTDHKIRLEDGGVVKEYTLRNKLALNDHVALLINKGGQLYYILDRVEVD